MIDNTATVEDSHNILAGTRGLSDYDNRHRFSLSSVYQLPIGEGRKLGSGLHGTAGMLISGWEINTVVQARSGQPFNPTITTDTSNTGESKDRPDLVGDPMKAGPVPGNASLACQSTRSQGGLAADVTGTAASWFNVCAFATPTTQRFGNAGRNILIGPGLTNFDFSLIKNTKVGEVATVQFRLEAFNALNHPNLDIPNAQMNNAAAGHISNTLAGFDARQIQFGLKIAY
jgi:hypothetical protein